MLEQIVITSQAQNHSVLMRELVTQFPSVSITTTDENVAEEIRIRANEWRRRDFDVYRFDYEIDRAGVEDLTLHIVDDDPPRPAALEILNRCQRAIGRRNRHTQTARFERALAAFRGLHDLAKPLVRADYNHALDTWQWLLRLEPDAPLALQLAALFHDIERLDSEADVRIEHRAPDYIAFKQLHAARGAEKACMILEQCGVDSNTRGRVAELITQHEQRSTEDVEVAVLNDADALSFFSLNSTGFADYYGPAHTRRKLSYTLARLGTAARGHLSSIHLRSDVEELFASCAE